MPVRKESFENKAFYHVLNQGVNGCTLYSATAHYKHFINLIDYLRFDTKVRHSKFKEMSSSNKADFLQELKSYNKPLVDIIAFCLMPNHFHLLLKQTADDGIQTFMRKLQNSYAKHYNQQQHRTGPLFNSPFKAIRTASDQQLSHVSRYIHLNPVSANIILGKDLINYPWSSYRLYFQSNDLVKSADILKYFPSTTGYKRFVLFNVGYQQELQVIKHLNLE